MDTFTLTGTLLDPEGVAHVGVKVHIVMVPTVKVDRDADVVYSRPVTAVTDALGQFSAALLTLPGLWYQVSCSLPVFTPNPLRFEAPGATTTLDIADIVDETPTPTYNAITVLIGEGGVSPDATTTTKGLVQLAGDLAGTAAAPTVPGLAGKATPADITAAVATEATNRVVAVTAEATARTAADTTEATARAAADATLQTNIDGKAATSHSHVASQISDSTTVGRAVLTAVDAAAARAATGAGTSNLALGTSGSTAKAGDYQPTAANISDSTATGRSVLTATDAAAARTAIGAGTSSLVVGTTTGTVAAGDDSRITGAVPSTRQVIAGTGLTGGGALSADRTLTVAYGATSTTAAVGNDSRLSDSRTPTAHAASHASAGSDPVTLAESQVTNLTTDLAAKVTKVDGGGETYYDAGNSSTAITLSLANGNVQKVTLTGNCTLTMTSPSSGVRALTLLLFQDGTGSRTMTWPASFKWGATGAPTLTTTASKMDLVSAFTVDSGTTWYAVAGPKAF